MNSVIGIDLGTTNSVVAYLENGRAEVIQNAEGSKTTPSVVYYPPQGGDVVVGEMAKRQRLLAPDRTVYSMKRFVGCRWDESEERRDGIEYPLAAGPNGLVAVRMDDQLLLPEQVQALVLAKMKKTAEDYLGQTIAAAVITCPAYFNDSQRQATKKAAELAGLEALRIIHEPTAAALAYGLNNRHNEKIAVFDFGGGTFDISILEIDQDVFEVKSTCGDTFLGGDGIDHIVVDWIRARLREEFGTDPCDDIHVLSRVTETAEKIKCELSTLAQTTISLPFIAAVEGSPRHFHRDLAREEFEAMIEPVLARLKAPCLQAMADADLAPSQLGAVILVGGSTHIPAVQRLVREVFGQEPNRSVSPEEAVARGAAIQAGVMSGQLDEILLLDVTPLSLGIELAGGLFSPLIPRNSSIPTTAHKKFTTVRDNQASVSVHVLQGERRQAAENRSLARFRLEGIAPAPREVPEIEVSFTLDSNGILNVAAMDLTTGNLQQTRVESYHPTMDGEVERMLKVAAAKADEDRQFTRKVAVRRRMEDMRLDIETRQKRPDLVPLDESMERRLQESFFRLDVALNQDDWSVIESAERELKSLHAEIMMLGGVTTGGDELVFETDEKVAPLAQDFQPASPSPTPAAAAAPPTPIIAPSNHAQSDS